MAKYFLVIIFMLNFAYIENWEKSWEKWCHSAVHQNLTNKVSFLDGPEISAVCLRQAYFMAFHAMVPSKCFVHSTHIRFLI